MLTQTPDIPLNLLLMPKLISLLFFSPRDIYTQQRNSSDTPSGFRRDKLTCNILLLCHLSKKIMQFDYCKRKHGANGSESLDASTFMFVPLCLHGCNNQMLHQSPLTHPPDAEKHELGLASPELRMY